ncbi:MAG: four helix bundle protein [Pyrinomonadaceae bacterium]
MFGIAKGSTAEVETLLLLSESLNYLTKEGSGALLKDCEEVAKLLKACSDHSKPENYPRPTNQWVAGSSPARLTAICKKLRAMGSRP